MRANEKYPDLDAVIDSIQKETIDPNTAREAGKRVWAKISAEMQSRGPDTIRGCDDFRALFPSYRDGALPEARNLLVRDHLYECVGCRREFMRQDAKAPAAPPRPTHRLFQVPRWAIAAALAIGVGLGSWQIWNLLGPPPAGAAASVTSVNGTLYRIADGTMEEIGPGFDLSAGQTIRAAKDTAAVIRLRDGSMVEVKARSGFSIGETRRDVTIRLDRGSVIVAAAERASGHLYVSTRDCRVAVTGTVFNVNSGMKGSRVSVVEGEVHVAQGSRNAILGPGDQYSSSPHMTKVPVAEEFAWSRNADRYVALLEELDALSEEMDRQVRMPGARYASRLARYLPAGTVLYAAMPNLGEAMADALRVFEDQLSRSPTLNDWWQKEMGNGKGRKLRDTVDEIRRFAAFLGDEIVIAATMDEDGDMDEPVFLAELRQSGLPEFVQAGLQAHGDMRLQVFSSAAQITDGAGEELLMYVNQGVVALAGSAGALRRIALAVEGVAGGFEATGFHDQIAAAYQEGASFLLGVDLERLKQGGDGAEILGNVRYLVIGQKEADGAPDTRAVVSFSGERTGVASWLAGSAPIGALDFVSPSATMASGFVIQEPTRVLDDLLANIPDFREDLAEAEARLGLSIRNDLARALGAEFAFAFDGPALPVPSWKLVAEVYDEATLQSSIARLIDTVNREVADAGELDLELSEILIDGNRYYLISTSKGPLAEIHYTFYNGYLIAAPTRLLVNQAITTQNSGATLVTSTRFTELLPHDGYNNFSAMMFHQFGSAVAGLSEVLSDQQKKAMGGLDSLMEPTLVLAHADRDHIVAASRSQALGLTPGNLFGLRIPMSLGGLFDFDEKQNSGEKE